MDDFLAKFRDSPVPDGLARIDEAVMAGLAARQNDARATSRLLPVAAFVALGIGYAGGSIIPAPASAAEYKLVLAETALAPSTLLDFL